MTLTSTVPKVSCAPAPMVSPRSPGDHGLLSVTVDSCALSRTLFKRNPAVCVLVWTDFSHGRNNVRFTRVVVLLSFVPSLPSTARCGVSISPLWKTGRRTERLECASSWQGVPGGCPFHQGREGSPPMEGNIRQHPEPCSHKSVTFAEPLMVESFGSTRFGRARLQRQLVRQGQGAWILIFSSSGPPALPLLQRPGGPPSAQLQLGLLPLDPVWPLRAPSPSKLDPDPGGSPSVRPRACSVHFRTQDRVLWSVPLG